MSLTIGKLASAAGVNAQTIRYYERSGLVRAPKRTAGGYRQFGADELRRLLFIRRAQGVGFSLAEIRELLALRIHDPRSCAAVSRRVEAKIAAAEEKIRELQKLIKSLNRVRASCAARTRTDDCPVLEGLIEDA
jgi:MerR family mercuric resistance operon transcriptional regulator